MFKNDSNNVATCNKAIDSIKNASNFAKWSISIIDKYIGNNILEIGAGLGTFTDFFLQKKTVITTEIDNNCFAELLKKYDNNPKIKVINGDILDESFVEIIKRDNTDIDTVICFNVLEHIEDDLKAIGSMKKCLGKDGYIILRVPAFNLLYSNLDKNVGHFRRYSKKDISEKILFNGLEIVDLSYMDIVGFMAWFFLFKILRKESFASENQIGIYDKLVPLFSKIEKLIKYPFGLTLFAVCKKKET